MDKEEQIIRSLVWEGEGGGEGEEGRVRNKVVASFVQNFSLRESNFSKFAQNKSCGSKTHTKKHRQLSTSI